MQGLSGVGTNMAVMHGHVMDVKPLCCCEGEDTPTTHSGSATRQLTLKGCHPCYFILVCKVVQYVSTRKGTGSTGSSTQHAILMSYMDRCRYEDMKVIVICKGIFNGTK